MKTKFITIACAFLFIFSSLQLSAQETTGKPYEDGFLKRFGVAAKIGTYGYGLDLHTSLLPQLKARVGFNYLAFDYNESFDFTADSPTEGQPTVEGMISDSKLNFPNANILFDFYPVKSGIFCITAGAYIGNNKVKAQGHADAPFVWDDLVITPVNGKFDANLKMGSTVKPYFGLGLGRTISNSRVGFRFDIGAVYQGNYTIESPQSSGSANGASVLDNEADLPFSSELLKLWPMMSFSISYRIK